MKKEEILTLLEGEALQEEQEIWGGFKGIGNVVKKIIKIGTTSGLIDTRDYK